MVNKTCDRPLAAKGLLSYRLRGRYGWVMIGARDHAGAMREAARRTQSRKTCKFGTACNTCRPFKTKTKGELP